MKLTLAALVIAGSSLSYAAEADKKLQQENAKYQLWKATQKAVFYSYQRYPLDFVSRLLGRSAFVQAQTILQKNPTIKLADALAYAPTADEMSANFQKCRNHATIDWKLEDVLTLGPIVRKRYDHPRCANLFEIDRLVKKTLNKSNFPTTHRELHASVNNKDAILIITTQ
jgi:hypothetical protein